MKWLARLLGRPADHVPDDAERRSVAGADSWLPVPSLAGVVVTSDTALSLTAVFACVNVIASSVASMPYLVYRRTKDGGRTPDPDHPNYDLLKTEPNDEMGAFAFWTGLVANAVLGNGYAEISRDESGRPTGLHLLDSRTTEPKRDANGRLYYSALGGPGPKQGQEIRLLPENVLHIANLTLNGISGLIPVQLAQQVIGAALAAEQTGAAVFGQGAMPVGALEVPNELDEEGRKNLRAYWNRVHGGPTNAGRVAILEEGTKFNPFKVDLAALQYNDTRRQAAKQIAQLFGVPPHKIGILDNATYGSLEEQDLDFYKSTLRIWCERIESEVDRKLFTRDERREWFAEHNMNATVRGNLASLTDHLTKMAATGVYSINDQCRELNLNPIGPAGDRRFVSAQLMPLEGFGPKGDPAPNAKADPADEPAEPTGQDVPPARDEAAVAAVRSVVLDGLQRAVRRETAALRRASKRPDLAGFAEAFYRDHAAFLAEALGPSLRALAVVTGREVDPVAWSVEVAESSRAALSQVDNVEAALSAWETNRATSLMGSLP